MRRRGDGGSNVAFKGDVPKMVLGLVLFSLVLSAVLWLVGEADRAAEDDGVTPAALAACEGWERVRDDLEGDHMPRDDQVDRVREIHALAERSGMRAGVFEVIADRLEQDVPLGDAPEQADRQCAQLTEDQPASVGR